MPLLTTTSHHSAQIMACLVPNESDLEHTWQTRVAGDGERDHAAESGWEMAIFAVATLWMDSLA